MEIEAATATVTWLPRQHIHRAAHTLETSDMSKAVKYKLCGNEALRKRGINSTSTDRRKQG